MEYLCDDCEEYFESERDPRHINYIGEKLCICDDCNDVRIFNKFG